MSRRLTSIDILRGAVMVVMALDHVRDFFHHGDFNPTDLSRTWPALFATRWITHFCAPVFVFLAGAGAALSTSSLKSRAPLARFLVTRGLWLILLELTFVRFAWSFNLDYQFTTGGVLWALGFSMIALAALCWLPEAAVAVFGLVMIAGHNALDGIAPERLGYLAPLWRILHAGGEVEVTPGHVFEAFYPLIPWIGVMAAGYGLARWFFADEARRMRRLAMAGSACIVLFTLLRGLNIYGDHVPWTPQKSPLYTVFSLINCEKYPPSLAYLLMTLGPALIALALLEWCGVPGRFARAIEVYGRVPMFYYLLHLPLIHGLAVLANLARYGHVPAGLLGDWSQPPPPGMGWNLPVVYAVWLSVVLALYPACRWFVELKRRRKEEWIRYL